ncbi:hypothetical protein BUE80_DR009517 [Diplocarpon rosae]|nr:hypothetical protein BUE80_DR009517 [Diplocarpon rosae]
MSTSADITVNGSGHADHQHILRPRAVKPENPAILRAVSEDILKTSNSGDGSNGIPSEQTRRENSSNNFSGRSTPIPADALPSVQSISSARKQLRAQQRRRLFPTIDYASRVSHFDPNSDYRDFQGFYILFWIALTIMATTTMLRNIKDTGYPMRVQIWQLFTVKIWELALADGLMVLTTAVSLPFHKLFRSPSGRQIGLKWAGGGMAIQSIYQIVWFSFWVAVPFIREWTWTAQVFLILHTFVLLMKMHSYSFYNGHLSETEHRLKALDEPSTASKAPAYQYPSAGHTSVSAEILQQNADEKSELARLREDLAIELTSPLGSVTYPKNLTWWNYFDYICCPTLCYELEYPRTDGIVWSQLGYKVLAVFGVIFLLTITSEEFILPVMTESALRLESVRSFSETALILAESISMLLFPFMVTFLLKIRGYGFLAQMSQLPIVMLQRTKWVKGKRVLNNICFWCSIILGLSMMCSLYVLI